MVALEDGPREREQPLNARSTPSARNAPSASVRNPLLGEQRTLAGNAESGEIDLLAERRRGSACCGTEVLSRRGIEDRSR